MQVGSGNSDACGGLTAGTATAAATMKAGTYDITTDGSAFSFSESYTQGDAVNPIGTGVDVATGVVADMPAFGITTTQSGGVAGSLAGTITSAGVMTLTAGGAGTTATGQFVSEVTVEKLTRSYYEETPLTFIIVYCDESKIPGGAYSAEFYTGVDD